MRRKTTKKAYHESDSSSDSDAPLLELRRSDSVNSLFKYSVERCEFCDRIFNNKYNMLVHNARHIIIPLINQKLHKCSQCHHFFNTIESLEWHAMNSHKYISKKKDYVPQILQSFVKREPVMVLHKEPLLNIEKKVNGIRDSESVNRDIVPEILKDLVQKEPVTVLTKLKEDILNDRILNSLVKREPITLVRKELFKFENDDESEHGEVGNGESQHEEAENGEESEDEHGNEEGNDRITIIDSDDDLLETDLKFETEYADIESGSENSRNTKIKDRIKFEDDEDEPVMLNLSDSVKLCNRELNRKKNAIILGNKPKQDCTSVSTDTESVHYDDLKKPGLYRCKKCSKLFPNRYETIIHETQHLTCKRRLPFLCRYCDWYISTAPLGLMEHKRQHHPEKTERSKIDSTKCQQCGLFYCVWSKHRRNYHNDHICKYCHNSFDTNNLLTEHINLEHTNNTKPDEQMWMIKTANVCEFCFQWFKDKKNLKYQHIKFYSKLGERLMCIRCEKLFFEVRLVRMRYRRTAPMKFKDNKYTFEVKKHVKKPLTNADRLKNVQQRLKLLKKINKF